MIQPEPLMPDDLIRTRNWADLTDAEKEALKDVAATEAEFRLLKLMLNTAMEPMEDIPAINPVVHERLKTAFREQHTPRGKVIGWWRYAAAAAVILAVAGTIWIIKGKNKKETEIAREEKTKTMQPVTPRDTLPPVQKDTTLKQPLPGVMNPAPEPMPVKPPKLRRPPVKQTTGKPAPSLPAIDRQPDVAVNINTSVKDNSELLQLVAAVY